MSNHTLSEALKERGAKASLARMLGIKVSTVMRWLEKERLPAERVLEVERVTGIPRHELRPDLYPRENAA